MSFTFVGLAVASWVNDEIKPLKLSKWGQVGDFAEINVDLAQMPKCTDLKDKQGKLPTICDAV